MKKIKIIFCYLCKLAKHSCSILVWNFIQSYKPFKKMVYKDCVKCNFFLSFSALILTLFKIKKSDFKIHFFLIHFKVKSFNAARGGQKSVNFATYLNSLFFSLSQPYVLQIWAKQKFLSNCPDKRKIVNIYSLVNACFSIPSTKKM